MAVEVHEALKLIHNHINQVGFEIVPIENALGRISAQQVFAEHFMPRFNNSAMDGYGVKCDDANTIVKITDTILAGNKKTPSIKNGQTIKIMTGAIVPDSVEAIVPQEDVIVIDESKVQLPSDIVPTAFIRYVGEDIKNGELLIDTGDTINFSKITLLATQGVTHIKIFKKPKVVVFASGEELKLHYEKIKKHQIYNSNTPTLIARAQELGCEVSFMGMAQDSVESLQSLIKNSLDADLIITSGGVSVGEADFTKEAFDSLGMHTFFDGIVVKPGKPTILGKINNTSILNLPGNPLASQLIFELFGKIIIQKLLGSKEVYHNYIVGKLTEDFSNKKGRITIVPGDFDGAIFTPALKRRPGMVSVLNNCNAMIVLDKNVSQLTCEDTIKILPINWKFYTHEKKDFLTYDKSTKQ